MLISKADIDAIKSRHDLVDFVGRHVELKQQGRVFVGRCLFHSPDKHPSLVVNPAVQLWNCLGACRAKVGKPSSGGDIFSFEMKRTGKTFREVFVELGGVVRDELPPPRAKAGRNGHAAPRAALKAMEEAGAPVGESMSSEADAEPRAHEDVVAPEAPELVAEEASPTQPRDPTPASLAGDEVLKSRAPRIEAMSRLVDHLVSNLSHTPAALEYLASRGLRTMAILRAFKVGYSDGTLTELAGTKGSSLWRLLRSMGLLDEEGAERMRGRVTLPLVAFNQLPVNLYGRAIEAEVEPRHLFLPGARRGLLNPNAARRSKEVLLVEGGWDLLSCVESGFPNVLTSFGIGEPTDDMRELLRRFGVTSVVVALDSDTAGKSAAPRLCEVFTRMGLRARSIEWPEKDPNELLVKVGPKRMREVLEKLLSEPKPRDLSEASREEAPEPAPQAAFLAPTPEGTRSSEADEALLFAPLERTPSDVAAPNLAAPELAPPESAAWASPSAEPPTTVEGAVIPSLTASSPLDVTLAPSEPSKETVSAAVREEKPGEAAVGARAAVEAHSPAPARPELTDKQLTLPVDERLWEVTWLDSPSEGSIRASLKVLVAGQLPGFRDSLNLLAARSRELFARRAAAMACAASAYTGPSAASSKPAPTPEEERRLARLIEADLLHLADLGEERRKALQETPKTEAMSEERMRRALAYLRAPHLLARIAEDIGILGYVGETTTKVLGYLVSISRKLPDALSMVILSSSGSGKSALAEVLERLTPQEDLLVVTRFTASSLYWMGKDALKRKFVSIEERSGSQEADYSIRALQSKKKVTLMAPIKDQATGRIETKFFEVEGPAAFLESTTESQIHHENATRCFEVRLDESPEQTARIQRAQRHGRTREGQRERLFADDLAALHQDVQRLLRPIRVVIPYANAIEFPAASIRTRRDNPRFLNLVEAQAFLHQYQRSLVYFETGEPADRPLEELSDEELADYRVEATLEDYGASYALASDLLYETLAELKKPLRSFFETVREMAREKAQGVSSYEVTLLTREIRERTGLPQHVVKRYLAELVELEYLAASHGVRGAASSYRLVDLPEKKDGRIVGLLLLEELLRKLGHGR